MTNHRLDQSKIDTAKEFLETRAEAETIEKALDLMALGEHLAAATQQALGRPWDDVLDVDP